MKTPDKSLETTSPPRRSTTLLLIVLFFATIALAGTAVWTVAHAAAAHTDRAQAQALGRRLDAIRLQTQNDLETMRGEQASIERLTARHEALTRIRKAERRHRAIERTRRRHRGQPNAGSG